MDCAGTRKTHESARLVEFHFSSDGDCAGDDGFDGDLSRGAAARAQSAERPARSHAGDAALVAGERAVWCLCSACTVQRNIWWSGGVIGLIIWMQLSAVIIFLGAAWNAELAESREAVRARG